MITERLMNPGSFNVTLTPWTPDYIRRQVIELGHIVVTAAQLPASFMAGADVLGMALYSGVVLERLDNDINGAGLEWWLGTQNHAGDAFTTLQQFSSVTLSSALSTVLPTTQPVAAGTVTNTGLSNITTSFQWVSRLYGLQRCCQIAGAEYRIRPNATVDAAAKGTLFTTTSSPKLVLTRSPAHRESTTLLGVTTEFTEVGFNAEQLVGKVWVLAKPGDGEVQPSGSATGSLSGYYDLRGNAANLEKLVDSPSTEATNANTIAQSVLNLTTKRTAVSLSIDLYAPTRHVIPGDSVYVWDHLAGIVDTSNKVPFRGEWILPGIVRVLGITWPLSPGMGVYYRTAAGVYLDLTPYVDWSSEAAYTKLEIGSQTSGADDANLDIGFGSPGLESRIFTAVTKDWTPFIDGSTTDPTLGTGSSVTGKYKIVDGLCWFQGDIRFGTSGVVAGSGTYTITGLPVAPVAGRGTFLCGTARLTDNTGPVRLQPISLLINDSGGLEMRYSTSSGTGSTDNIVGATTPWTWAASDRLEFEGSFPVL